MSRLLQPSAYRERGGIPEKGSDKTPEVCGRPRASHPPGKHVPALKRVEGAAPLRTKKNTSRVREESGREFRSPRGGATHSVATIRKDNRPYARQWTVLGGYNRSRNVGYCRGHLRNRPTIARWREIRVVARGFWTRAPVPSPTVEQAPVANEIHTSLRPERPIGGHDQGNPSRRARPGWRQTHTSPVACIHAGQHYTLKTRCQFERNFIALRGETQSKRVRRIRARRVIQTL